MERYCREIAQLSDELQFIMEPKAAIQVIKRLLHRNAVLELEVLLELYSIGLLELCGFETAVESDNSALDNVYFILQKYMAYEPRISADNFVQQCDSHSVKLIRVFAKFLRQIRAYQEDCPDFDIAELLERDQSAPEEEAQTTFPRQKCLNSQFQRQLEAEIERRRKYRLEECRKTPSSSPEKKRQDNKGRHAGSELMLSSDTLRQAESELMKKYGTLDASAQKASESAEAALESQRFIDKQVDKILQ